MVICNKVVKIVKFIYLNSLESFLVKVVFLKFLKNEDNYLILFYT